MKQLTLIVLVFIKNFESPCTPNTSYKSFCLFILGLYFNCHDFKNKLHSLLILCTYLLRIKLKYWSVVWSPVFICYTSQKHSKIFFKSFNIDECPRRGTVLLVLCASLKLCRFLSLHLLFTLYYIITLTYTVPTAGNGIFLCSPHLDVQFDFYCN